MLDTFIRGLSGDITRLLGIRKPKSLPEALHLCLKLENQSFRAQYPIIKNTIYHHPLDNNNIHNNNLFNQNISNHNVPKKQIKNFNQQQRRSPPPRPPKPPQPMDVDVSLRTNAINYTNPPRPQDFGKIPYQTSIINHPPPKIQRNFHVNSGLEPNNEHNYQYDNDCQNSDYNYNPSNTTHRYENEPFLDLTDVHFCLISYAKRRAQKF